MSEFPHNLRNSGALTRLFPAYRLAAPVNQISSSQRQTNAAAHDWTTAHPYRHAPQEGGETMAEPIVSRGMGRCERLGDPDDADGAVAAAVARAQAGETDAIGFLYRRYAPNVRAYVGKIVGDEHDAEDVTQHLFAKLMASALSRYQPRSLPFSRWLL